MTEKRLNLPTLKVDISLNDRLGKTAMHLWGYTRFAVCLSRGQGDWR